MTPRVIGLDLSLTATGIADFRGREVTTKTIRSAPNGKTLPDQRIRLRRIVLEIEEVVSHQGEPPRLIVVEEAVGPRAPRRQQGGRVVARRRRPRAPRRAVRGHAEGAA